HQEPGPPLTRGIVNVSDRCLQTTTGSSLVHWTGGRVAESIVLVCDVCGAPAKESVIIRAKGRHVTKDPAQH
ncbi:MAG: hypothetical protein M3O88_01410, partial [Actinomycetota bacterium]|nr:hypothetical protein [Actinomycetota bacterium]